MVDHFLYSRDLYAQLRGDTVRRNQILITPRDPRVNITRLNIENRSD